MKKLIILVAGLSLLIATPVFADETSGGGQAVSNDTTYSYDDTGWWNNDDAEAGGSATTDAFFEYNAQGSKFVQGAGIAHANDPTIESWAKASDPIFSQRSESEAGAIIESGKGNAFAATEAIGSDGFFRPGDAETTVGVGIEGSLYQNSSAKELGLFGGASGSAGQGSELAFRGEKSDTNGDWFGISVNAMKGLNADAIVEGKTVVEVDAYGSDRSAFASAQNKADLSVDHRVGSYVAGGGGVNVEAHFYNSPTGGNAGAGFSYDGATSGHGAAQAETIISPNSATSTASSYAGSN